MEKLITVIGTTASGKSDLGIVLAKQFNGEIISCDSRQIYKGLDLGTGKVTIEEQNMVKHHLIDIIQPNESFSTAQFQKLAYASINDVLERGKQPFLVGGTGLYARSVTQGYVFNKECEHQELRNSINQLSKEQMIEKLSEFNQDIPDGLSPRHLSRRLEKAELGSKSAPNQPRYNVLQLVMSFERQELYNRIELRLDKRIEQGMIDEVEKLMTSGATDEFLENLGLEYRYTKRYLRGEYDFATYRDELFKQIRHFAKRQVTWFKKEENAVWLDTKRDYEAQAKQLVYDFLSKNN